ncbi:protein DCL homolog, chloroplastic-like [Prosopis cineraria]|uniref:protein DCL homolog, chloroplastic-like n=1 Tax=Prosopis cineraria TaxID=364024 RepID=UPI00240FAC7D|nr:protein DCL homolog, chloroplastic-like [Prosopis cineraria]XP_054793301.1 protein DCL homolog, chloroplastic-like [Prosopis cineraria]
MAACVLHSRIQGLNYRGITDGIGAKHRPVRRSKAYLGQAEEKVSSVSLGSLRANSPIPSPREAGWDYRKRKNKEAEILWDIEPILLLTKHILQSPRYMDGERLTVGDEKAVVDKLLAYHPRFQDKVGCGLQSIMVDRHPQFQNSRCLFVVRTDGGWIDFSYQKCLREYIRDKYPAHAERFIREHFKRGSR